jgi:tryptophan-rich sensory protein
LTPLPLLTERESPLKDLPLCIFPEGVHMVPFDSAKADNALQLYYAQLALNLLWSPIFFGSQSPKIALVNIVALTATAAKWALDMSDIYTTPISANWLTVPYVAWLGYALLNWERPGDKRI